MKKYIVLLFIFITTFSGFSNNMENSDYNPIINNVDDFVSFLDVGPNREYILEKRDDYLEIQFLNDPDDFAIEVRYLGEDNGKKYYIGKGVSYTYSMYYKIFSFQNNSFKNEVNINEIKKNENINYADYSYVDHILIDELKRPHTLIISFSSAGSGSWGMDLLIFNYIENEFILIKKISGNSINSSLKQTEDKIMLKVEMYKPLRYVNKIQGRASTAAQYDMLGGNMKIISLYHFDNESKEYVLKERKTEMNEYGLVNQYLLALDYPYGENLSDSYSYYYNESESLKIKNVVKVRKNTDLLEFILNEELDKIIKVNYLKNYFGPSNDEGKKWSFETEDYVGSSPAIGSDGTIYVGSGHSLYAINPDGTEKWSFETEGYIGSSPAIGSDGTIYIGSGDSLYAINPDGTEKWSFEVDRNISSSAIGQDGTIYVGSGDGNLYAINPDGTGKWSFETEGYEVSSPAIGSDGTIYVGSKDGRLYAINPDGTEKWSFKTRGSVKSSPAIGQNGTIYVGSYWSGWLYAINPDGTEKWSFETGSVESSPAIGQDGTIYVGSWDSRLYAINPDGTEKWSFEVDPYISSSPAIGQDGTIYVGGNGRVYAINPDGTKKWSFETGGYIGSSPAIGSDGTIYVGSGDGKLYAIEGNSGGLADSPWPKLGKNNRNTGNYNDSDAFSYPTIEFKGAENEKKWEVFIFKDEKAGKKTGVAISPLIAPTDSMGSPYSDIEAALGVGYDGKYEWVCISFIQPPKLSGTELGDENEYDIISTRIKWDDVVETTELIYLWGSNLLCFIEVSEEVISKIINSDTMLLELNWYGEGKVYFQFPLVGAAEAINEIHNKFSE